MGPTEEAKLEWTAVKDPQFGKVNRRLVKNSTLCAAFAGLPVASVSMWV